MTREELYQKWIIQEYDTEGIDREAFFKDLEKVWLEFIADEACYFLSGVVEGSI